MNRFERSKVEVHLFGSRNSDPSSKNRGYKEEKSVMKKKSGQIFTYFFHIFLGFGYKIDAPIYTFYHMRNQQAAR